jgi:hypothetical protein
VFLISTTRPSQRPFPPTELAAVEDTVADLERALGMPTGSLQHTVGLHNEHAARGEDPLFHKAAESSVPLVHPPFAALDYRTRTRLYTVLHARRPAHAPDGRGADARTAGRPGLWAAGRTTSGLAAQGYSSGLSLADASSSDAWRAVLRRRGVPHEGGESMALALVRRVRTAS